ncbi:TetR/AcrR family transcriptional regulator [Streptomyces dangxiongensis]|uniref:TetR/AcrR family transcriptional regulator n=1 Tax=Streptomyces dangxiongensis TaxID=1442032 RepID=A0A3G2JRQ4_9ACTN|nr:TetR/AcrR family transcriptional regulator [Streptomyces dangxiongensis]AYN43467.1 TetR/AcrR family transcriptional regulator [Streptomyces dangxiongensis]
MEATKRTPIGRPRGFDTDEALQRAMVVFWEHGYDAVSLTDLTRAMGITKTSMYAAFGNKEDLFRKALERYAEGPASYSALALREPTARKVATAYLTGSVHASTRAGCPAGCLGVQGFLAAGRLGRSASDALVAWRNDNRAHLHDRFRRAIDEGDLPAGTNPDTLARYLMTMANGIAVQAAMGATRDELQQVADAALHTWPPA